MRKGTTLVELLVVIITISLLLVFFAKLFNTLFTETPKTWKHIQTNSTILNILNQLQHDIDKAENLPESAAEYVSDSNMLLIELAAEKTLIGYEFSDEKVIRHILKGSSENSEQSRIWLLPKTKFDWKILRKEDFGYALEIQNRIEYEKGKRLEKKMANSHLYFTGAL